MAEKSARNLKEAIDASLMSRPMWRLASGLGMPNVGEVAARQIGERFPDLRALLARKPEEVEADLAEVHGFGPIMAASVREFLEDPGNRETMEKLVRAGMRTVAEKAADTQGSLSGISFCLTGKLSRPRARVQERIRQAGGEVHDTVRKGTTYLVAGEDVGRTKIEKAQKTGARVISEDDLERLISGGTVA
jgi:DNA ligase (NAD+)